MEKRKQDSWKHINKQPVPRRQLRAIDPCHRKTPIKLPKKSAKCWTGIANCMTWIVYRGRSRFTVPPSPWPSRAVAIVVDPVPPIGEASLPAGSSGPRASPRSKPGGRTGETVYLSVNLCHLLGCHRGLAASPDPMGSNMGSVWRSTCAPCSRRHLAARQCAGIGRIEHPGRHRARGRGRAVDGPRPGPSVGYVGYAPSPANLASEGIVGAMNTCDDRSYPCPSTLHTLRGRWGRLSPEHTALPTPAGSNWGFFLF